MGITSVLAIIALLCHTGLTLIPRLSILIETSFNTNLDVTYTNNITQVLNVTLTNVSCSEYEQNLNKPSDIDCCWVLNQTDVDLCELFHTLSCGFTERTFHYARNLTYKSI